MEYYSSFASFDFDPSHDWAMGLWFSESPFGSKEVLKAMNRIKSFKVFENNEDKAEEDCNDGRLVLD